MSRIPTAVTTSAKSNSFKRKFEMSSLSEILTAAFVALVIATPAMANDRGYAPSLRQNNLYMFADGQMIHTKVDKATRAMIMKEFKPIGTGAMIYASGDEFYVGQDLSLASGKM